MHGLTLALALLYASVMNAIERACKCIGGQAELSRRLGVTSAAISQWKNGDRPIPAERCPDIERATDGQVTCEELRPDLSEQWSFLRGTKKAA